MSEIKLNLLDSHTLLVGTVHGSTGDRLVAALSAEPETIEELEAAFKRFEKDGTIFGMPPCRNERCEIDDRPWDAGILVIDLAARIIACESTYSLPLRSGTVDCYDRAQCKGLRLRYRLADDWLILRSIEEYQVLSKRQLKKRAPPLDRRAILYGEPLLNFIARNAQLLNVQDASPGSCLSPTSTSAEPLKFSEIAGQEGWFTPAEDPSALKQPGIDDLHALTSRDLPDPPLCSDTDEPSQSLLLDAVVDIHRRWLMTPRDDLNGQSPREVLFAKQDLVDLDLDSRMNQWSYFLEEPPCLSRDSHAYRYAGFGTHEWVMYYDLVRFLIWQAADLITTPEAQHASACRALANYSFTSSFSSGSGEPQTSEPVSTVSCEEVQRREPNGNLPFTPSFSLGPGDTTQPETVSTVSNEQSLIALLDQLKNIWLSEPREDYIPAEVIDNERRRRPEAMTGRSMVIDEDCPLCKLSGDRSESGLEITFCHFDGSHMEDEFAFSWFATLEEWEQEQREREQRDRERELRKEECQTTNSSSNELTGEFDIPF